MVLLLEPHHSAGCTGDSSDMFRPLRFRDRGRAPCARSITSWGIPICRARSNVSVRGDVSGSSKSNSDEHVLTGAETSRIGIAVVPFSTPLWGVKRVYMFDDELRGWLFDGMASMQGVSPKSEARLVDADATVRGPLQRCRPVHLK